ncbi:PAS domain-containing protein [Halohasta litchfieldiae]|jgi:signal transduction histidine kinase|uniref:histidine kinase n=1 Tax=Halohasta litchfieldiae TaxID=1073996 RepID=A0A1H6XFN0_9EURY|nr:ATP-binding protein [Halohasta litchfieldiae]ATW88337.1 PAS domain-containing protein [Halohasta litchfieldiae]SEJ25487.1 PAS fold-containing protein [Halohasta litchfieldiae]
MTAQQLTTTTNHFESLFNQLNDPTVEFKLEDDEPIIVQANAAFREVFCADESVTGLPLNELIVPDDQRDEAKTFDQRTADGKPNRAVIERMTSNGPRKFLYRGVPTGEEHGFAIYSDITDKLRRERYLDVLQRVLRHNLRNDVNIITAYSKHAVESAENEQTREALESVIETADSLTQLCSEANTIRKVLDEPTSVEPIDLHAVIETVEKDCRERFSEADITVDCPRGLTVAADKRLQIVVDSLLDNAIRHNTSAIPKAIISANVDDGMIELIVADNGPGIPQTERQIVTESMDVSPLKHGSGLGLWLVKWLTERYGGSLEIEIPEDFGTAVRLRLPRSS